MSAGELVGRLALVTGAGSGIGRAACQVLSRDGATVVAADSNYGAAERTLAEFTSPAKEGHTAAAVDVRQMSSVRSLLDSILEKYRRPPRIVVYSAGITRDNWLLSMTEEEFDDVVDVNLKGTYLVTQAFAKAMVEAKVTSGSIVSLSSNVAIKGNKGHINYVATKSGVLGLTKSAAKELGRHNIRVNAILPGFIKTPMFLVVPEAMQERYKKEIALGRLGEPSEVGEVVAFLASDKSSFMTGSQIDVCGGWP